MTETKIQHGQSIDPAFKKEWVEALRSDEFEQGIGCLKREVGADGVRVQYCCLGVAAELVRRKHPGRLYWQGSALQDENNIEDGSVASGDTLRGLVTREMKLYTDPDWAAEIGNASRRRETITLYFQGVPEVAAHLNDGVKLTFKEIADLIEEQL